MILRGASNLGRAHSFPTRRSSDLSQLAASTSRAATRGPVWTPSTGHSAWRFRWIDRKSTRLNSSHLGISYAVFCLKKKTQLLGEGCAASGRIDGLLFDSLAIAGKA